MLPKSAIQHFLRNYLVQVRAEEMFLQENIGERKYNLLNSLEANGLHRINLESAVV